MPVMPIAGSNAVDALVYGIIADYRVRKPVCAVRTSSNHQKADQLAADKPLEEVVDGIEDLSRLQINWTNANLHAGEAQWRE